MSATEQSRPTRGEGAEQAAEFGKEAGAGEQAGLISIVCYVNQLFSGNGRSERVGLLPLFRNGGWRADVDRPKCTTSMRDSAVL